MATKNKEPIDREDYTSLDLVVYRTYNYRGVNVLVKLDFIDKTVSLVEKDDNKESGFKPKDWLFSDRGVEYLNGWRLILKAMDYAITEAKRELELSKKKDLDKLLNFYVELDKVKAL